MPHEGSPLHTSGMGGHDKPTPLPTSLRVVHDSVTLEYLRNQQFIGRSWLLEELHTWSTDPLTSETTFVVRGSRGMGKSAFLAHLATRSAAVIAHHFCCSVDARSLDPAVFVRSMAAQLSDKIPAFRSALVRDPEAQAILQQSPLSQPAHALERGVISLLRALPRPPAAPPVLKRTVSGTMAPSTPSSPVVRPRTRPDSRPSSSRVASDRSSTPSTRGSGRATQLSCGAPSSPALLDAPFLLVVDGLDEEGDTTRHGTSVASILEVVRVAATLLPPWIRLVVSAAPGRGGIVDSLPSAAIVDLDSHPRAQKDLSAFITHRVEDPGVLASWSHSVKHAGSSGGATVVESLRARACILPPSSGNFLFSVIALKCLEMEAMGPVKHVLPLLEEIPAGLDNLFTWIITHYFRDQEHKDGVQTILQILLAARAPIPTSVIAAASHEDPSSVLSLLKPLLWERRVPGTGDPDYILMHQSVVMWLTSPSGTITETGIHPSPRFGHDSLANVGLEELETDLGIVSPYLVRFLTSHLRAAERSDEIVSRLLFSFAWLEQRLRGQGTDGIQQDVLLALGDDIQGTPPRTNARGGSDLSTLVSVLTDMAPILRNDPHQLASQLLSRLPATGKGATQPIRDLLEQASRNKPYNWIRPLHPFLPTDTQLLCRTLEGHCCPVLDIAVTSDGVHVVSAGEDSAVRVWHLPTGTTRHILLGHSGPTMAVTLALEDSNVRIVSGSMDTDLRVWDLASGTWIRTLSGHSAEVLCLRSSPSGRYVASASADGTVRIWDVAAGKCIRTIRDHDGPVKTIAFSPDGRLLASATAGDVLHVWDARTGQEVHKIDGYAHGVETMEFSSDGRRLITGSRDRIVKVRAVNSGRKILHMEGHRDIVQSVAVSMDGKYLVSGGGPRDMTLRVWESATGKTVIKFEGHTDAITSTIVMPDGTHLLSASRDGTIKLWECSWGDTHTNAPIATVAITPNLCFLSGSFDGAIRQATTGDFTATAHQVIVSNKKWVSAGAMSVVPSRDGSLLAVGSLDGVIRLMEYPSLRLVHETPGGKTALLALDLAADNTTLVAGLANGTIDVWPLSGWMCYTLKGHTCPVRALLITRDNAHVVSGADDGSIYLWNLKSGKELRSFQGHTASVHDLAEDPDGRYFVSASGDWTTRMWEVSSGRCLAVLQGHNGPVNGVALTLDGSRAITASDDHSLRVWNIQDGSQVARLDLHYTPLALRTAGRKFTLALVGDQSGQVHCMEILKDHEDPAASLSEHRGDLRIRSHSVFSRWKRRVGSLLLGELSVLKQGGTTPLCVIPVVGSTVRDRMGRVPEFSIAFHGTELLIRAPTLALHTIWIRLLQQQAAGR